PRTLSGSGSNKVHGRERLRRGCNTKEAEPGHRHRACGSTMPDTTAFRRAFTCLPARSKMARGISIFRTLPRPGSAVWTAPTRLMKPAGDLSPFLEDHWGMVTSGAAV